MATVAWALIQSTVGPVLDLAAQRSSLDDWQAVAGIAAGFAVVVGIVVGGAWVYWLYVRQRTRWPRAELELVLTHRALTDVASFVHTKVKIHNAGRGLMQPAELRVDLHRVLPLSQTSRVELAKRGNLLDENRSEAEWPCIGSRKSTWGEHGFEIEPGESDECNFDFFIKADVRTVFVYVYLDNQAKRPGIGWRKRRPLGWSLTSIYNLAAEAGKARTVSPVGRKPMLEGPPERPPKPPPDEEPVEGRVPGGEPAEGDVQEGAPAEGDVQEEAPAEGDVQEEAPAEGDVQEEAPAEGGVKEAQRERRPEPEIEQEQPQETEAGAGQDQGNDGGDTEAP